MSLWREEYQEAKTLGAATLYLCAMELRCATYRKGKLVGLCKLIKSESSSYSGTVAVSLNSILDGSTDRYILMKACPKKQGFMSSKEQTGVLYAMCTNPFFISFSNDQIYGVAQY